MAALKALACNSQLLWRVAGGVAAEAAGYGPALAAGAMAGNNSFNSAGLGLRRRLSGGWRGSA